MRDNRREGMSLFRHDAKTNAEAAEAEKLRLPKEGESEESEAPNNPSAAQAE